MESATALWLDCVVYGVSGLVIGRVVDIVNGGLRKRPLPKQVALLMQVAIIALVPASFHYMGMAAFIDDWQLTTAGLFFASMFMGMQSNLVSTMQESSL